MDRINDNHMYIINSVLLLLLIAGDIAYIITELLVLKAVTSVIFVLIGVLNLLYVMLIKKDKSHMIFGILICIGLFFAMLGDIILEIHFITGAVLFAVAHVFYFISYIKLSKFCLRDLICFACICIPSILVVVFFPNLDYGSVLMEVVACLYAVVISLMVGKALSNLIGKRTMTNIYVFLGSTLFFLSDLMLLFNVFGGGIMLAQVLCLSLYYPAEFALAYSIYIAYEDNKVKENMELQEIESTQEENREDK